MADQSIPETTRLCQDSLSSLIAAAAENKSEGLGEALGLRTLEQLRDRFDQWAGNLGALQSPRSPLSLENRLRDSPVVRDAVLRLLSDLLESLESATDIAAGRRLNRRAQPVLVSELELAEYDLSSSDSDSDCGSAVLPTQTVAATSEIDELMLATKSGIDNLFRASIFIRKHAPKDKRQRASAAKPFDNRADVMYVRDRYPLAAAKNESLVARLGEANARRRQYFKYCRDHNERLSTLTAEKNRAQGPDSRSGHQPGAEVNPTGERTLSRHVGTDSSLLADTKATEFVAGEFEATRLSKELQELSARSVVSFATTVAEPSGEELGFPPLPSEAESNSVFLCPYCFKIVALKGTDKEGQWRKHVLDDLEPYICTFPSCGLETYQSQHSWFEHELLLHRSVWVCYKCSSCFKSPDKLEQHIALDHGQDLGKNQIAALVEGSRRYPSSIQPRECPFCDGTWASPEPGALSADEEAVIVVDIDQFRRHLGHHLQQIALFALPRQNQADEAGSNDVAPVLDRDSIPQGGTWERQKLGRGWRLVISKMATLTALATFLDLCVSNRQGPAYLSSDLFEWDLDDVPELLKKVEDDWSIVYMYGSGQWRGLGVNLSHTIPQSMPTFDVRFSLDGKYMANASFGSVNIFNVNSGALLHTLMLPNMEGEEYPGSAVFTVCFSPEGDRIVAGDSESKVTIWDIESEAILYRFEGHTDEVYSICWALDGKTIASSSADCTIRVWDLENATCRLVLPTGSGAKPIAIADESEVIVGGGVDGQVKVWTLRTGHLLSNQDGEVGEDGHSGGIFTVEVPHNAPQGLDRCVLTGSSDKTVKLWSALPDRLQCAQTWVGHKDNVTGAVVFPHAKPIFVSGSEDGCLAFWSLGSTKAVALLRTVSPSNENSIVAIAAAQGPGTSHRLATAHGDGLIRLWNIFMEPRGLNDLML